MAIFCIAVGVMAVVSLRLVADMITVSVTGDVRTANGGDISIQAIGIPLTGDDIAQLRNLKQNGTIANFAALGTPTGTIRTTTGHNTRVSPLYVVTNAADFPLVGDGGFVDSGSTHTFATALGGRDGIVISQFVSDEVNAHIGDHVHLTVLGGGGRDVTITGIVADKLGVQGSSVAYINTATYAATATATLRYGAVYITTRPGSNTAAVAAALRKEFPETSIQTVDEALATNLAASQQVTSFLLIVGLLALLIGGIGIINTVQVLLSRRRIEIAMLRTTGYRRRDLYALFGLETGVLGLVGGAIGTAVGVALSLGVKVLVEHVITIPLVFHIDPMILVSGVVIGVATALIFGLLPIVRATAVRPALVLRETTAARSKASWLVTGLLYLLDAALYATLAAVLLGDVQLAVTVVAVTAAVIGVLTGSFALVATLIGLLPVPERTTVAHLLRVTAAVAVAAALTVVFPGAGSVVLVMLASGYAVGFLPRRARNVVKLAMRSVGRARGRTAATLVALFTGVFSVGLIVIVGSDISNKLDSAVSTLTDYSVIAIAPSDDGAHAAALIAGLPGLQAQRTTHDIAVAPTAVDGVDIQAILKNAQRSNAISTQFRLTGLSGVEGYDLSHGQLPDTAASRGRVLTAADAGHNNVMVPDNLRGRPLNLRAGETLTIQQPTSGTVLKVTVVGFYTQFATSPSGVRIKTIYQPVLGDTSLVSRLGVADAETVTALRFDPSGKAAALHSLEAADPNITVFDFADLAALAQEFLGNIIVLLVAIASLSLFAGVVIIANTVALAMLERRREIGILKATGHTSASVLAQVLVEYSIIGGVAATAGMLAVSVATIPLGKHVLKIDLGVSTLTVLAIIVAVVALCSLVAGMVAWKPTRIRPVEVLRYE